MAQTPCAEVLLIIKYHQEANPNAPAGANYLGGNDMSIKFDFGALKDTVSGIAQAGVAQGKKVAEE